MIRSASYIGDENAAEAYILEWSRRYNEAYPGIEIIDEDRFIDSMLNYLSDQIDSGEELLTEDDFDMESIRELVNEIKKEN
jgi:hypothetical protein